MNEQEKFWSGVFGNNYTNRSSQNKLLLNNLAFFKKILKKKYNIKSLIELGANNGSNILAIKKIKKKLKKITAVEINSNACIQLKKIRDLEIINIPISKLNLKEKFDMVLLKGF